MTALMKKTDAALLSAYFGGKDKAFETLFKRYKVPLFSFIVRFVGDRKSAEDLFQQTWLKALNALPQYEERGSFPGWLFGIANNCCVDYVRSKTRELRDESFREASLDTLPACEDNPAKILEKKESLQWLKRSVNLLPLEQKQVVLLRIYGDLQFKEIAKLLRVPLNTVLARMHYAVRNLRKRVISEKKEVSNDALS